MAIKFQYNKTSLQQLEKQLKVRVRRFIDKGQRCSSRCKEDCRCTGAVARECRFRDTPLQLVQCAQMVCRRAAFA